MQEEDIENPNKDVAAAPDDVGLSEAVATSGQGRYAVAQKRVQLVVEHIIFRLFTMVLILLDLIIVIIDVSNPKPVFEYIGIVIVTFFIIEVSLRVFCLGPRVFFANWINIVDFGVIWTTFIVTIAITAAATSDTARLGKLVVLARLIRLPRLIVLLRVVITERQHLARASRKMVSQNKRRYRQDGYDLDLCYITDKIIAMSFPSSGLMALYRNPIGEVARFLDEKHNGHYKVYNLCSERCYDSSYFHGRTLRVLIDDHNVPMLSDMVIYAKDVQEWMSQDKNNIIVVHCKGGKGRTGTMICTYMVDSGLYDTSKDCLEFFGRQRTDYLVGRKFQGVETPSQNRYVGYFETVKKQFNYSMPPDVRLKIVEIVLHGLSKIGNGDGSDIWFEIFAKTDKIFECDVQSNKNCESHYRISDDELHVKLRNAPSLLNDIKFRFYSRNKTVPVAYEKCAFFFWFYTYFIQENKLRLARSDLDNPHKEKTWSCWHEGFAIELFFEHCTE